MKMETISVTIDRRPEEVYDFIMNPDHLQQWIPSFAESVGSSGDDLIVETSEGPMKFRFVKRNEYGVADHFVTLMSGECIYNPMRVIANGSCSEVVFTLFKRPDMSDEQYSDDARNVKSDLYALKAVLERS
ncbi:MAG: polyketide cyclase [Paenibacillus sp.]|nr:polyketide cyclase [Paenibacillus sp.]